PRRRGRLRERQDVVLDLFRGGHRREHHFVHRPDGHHVRQPWGNRRRGRPRLLSPCVRPELSRPSRMSAHLAADPAPPRPDEHPAGARAPAADLRRRRLLVLAAAVVLPPLLVLLYRFPPARSTWYPGCL